MLQGWEEMVDAVISDCDYTCYRAGRWWIQPSLIVIIHVTGWEEMVDTAITNCDYTCYRAGRWWVQPSLIVIIHVTGLGDG